MWHAIGGGGARLFCVAGGPRGNAVSALALRPTNVPLALEMGATCVSGLLRRFTPCPRPLARRKVALPSSLLANVASLCRSLVERGARGFLWHNRVSAGETPTLQSPLAAEATSYIGFAPPEA